MNFKTENDAVSELIWSIEASEQSFSLIFARCNYIEYRNLVLTEIHKTPNIVEVNLSPDTTNLFQTMKASVEKTHPAALMVLGLESCNYLVELITQSNQIREEFRNNFSFTLVFWIHDEALKKFMRLAPDMFNWGTTVEFSPDNEELLNLFQIHTENLWEKIWAVSSVRDFELLLSNLAESNELQAMLTDITQRNLLLNPDKQAEFTFLNGLSLCMDNQINDAVNQYQQCLTYWQNSQDLQKCAIVFYMLAKCYDQDIDKAKDYLQNCVEYLIKAERFGLSVIFSYELFEALFKLKQFDELEQKAKAVLHLKDKLPDDVDFSACTIALANSALYRKEYDNAVSLSKKTIETSTYPVDRDTARLIFAKAQKELKQFQQAIEALESAKVQGNPKLKPELYIDILDFLHKLYFYDQKDYRKAFKVKQELLALKHEFGFLAFIGAGPLKPRQLVEKIGKSAFHEITASGRQRDVETLIQRVEADKDKLIILHGHSGVGKSSILMAGLVPKLNYMIIKAKRIATVVVRTYSQWLTELTEKLSEAINHSVNDLKVSTDTLVNTLRDNYNKRNLSTVIVFDQFEEFFFDNPKLSDKKTFYDFLNKCLDIPFVTVILSIREDYLHFLLELDKIAKLQITNNDILRKDIRHPVGNLLADDAKTMITTLTQSSGFVLEDNLIDMLIQELKDESNEVRPIELQIVGSQLQSRQIKTLTDYNKLKTDQHDSTKSVLIEGFLEEAVNDCGGGNEDPAWMTLYYLTDEEKRRLLKTETELFNAVKSLVPDLTTEQLRLILEVLTGSGLLFEIPGESEKRYQIVHDYVAEQIRIGKPSEVKNKLEEELKEAKRQEEIAEAISKEKQEAEKKEKEKLKKLLEELQIQKQLSDEAKNKADQSAIEAYVNLSDMAYYLAQARTDNLDAAVIGVKANVNLKKLNASYETIGHAYANLICVLENINEKNRLEGHTYFVSSVSFSPDGNTLVSGSLDKTIKLWNVSDGSLIRTLEGHTKEVSSVGFSPDGNTLASGSWDRTIKLWNVSDGSLLRTLEGHTKEVSSVSFSPDGNTLVSGSWDRTIKLWNVSDGSLIRTLEGHIDGVLSVSFSPGDSILASGSWDNKIKLWNMSDGSLIRTGLAYGVICVSLSPDGNILASGNGDTTIKLWNMSDGSLIRILEGHGGHVESVSFSPDGNILASGSSDKTIRLWNMSDGSLIRTLEGLNNEVWSVSFSPDGNTLASGSSDDTIRLWNISNDSLIRTLEGHNNSVESISFSPDGNTLASGSSDDAIRLWNMSDDSLIRTLEGHNNSVESVSFSPDGNTLASGSADKTIRLWNMSDGSLIRILEGHTWSVKSVSFSLDGNTLASGSWDKTIKLWNVSDGSLIRTLEGHIDGVLSISFSPDGNTLASGSRDKTIKLWNVSDGSLIRTLEEHTKYVFNVSFSPDGNMLAWGSGDATIKLWNVLDGSFLRTLEGHTWPVESVNFSPDSNMLASGSQDNTIKLWNVSNGSLIGTLEGHTNYVLSVSFSSNGNMLASGSKDKTIKLWPLDIELLRKGCEWIVGYLKNNPNVREEDRRMCDEVLSC